MYQFRAMVTHEIGAPACSLQPACEARSSGLLPGSLSLPIEIQPRNCHPEHSEGPASSDLDLAMQNAMPVSPFRMKTCESVSKQRTLTTFRINTYENHRGGGRVPNLRGTFSLTLCLCASVANPMFSAACRLFVVSLRSFPHSLPLFSIDCSLFSQNTRVGVGRGPSRQTFQHGALTLLARVASSTLASPTILRPLLRITGGRPRAGCNLSDSQRLENRRPKFFEHVAAGNNPHLNSVSLKRLPSGPLRIRQIGVGQAFGAQ